MLKYLLNRLLQSLLVMFIVVTVVFFVLRVIGDPARLLLSPEGTMEDLERLRSALGLDQPVLVQYYNYLKGIITLDFGSSLRYNQPVLELIGNHLPKTLLLSGTSLLIAIPLSLLFGIIIAVKRNSIFDYVITSVAIAGRAMPSFWLGLLLILVFSVKLGLLPPSGAKSWKHLILPVITLSAGLAASTTRLTRSSMLEVLRQDYMTTARAKGLIERRVLIGHGLRNALLPVVTMIGLQVGRLFSGSVVIETVFAWPGIGRLMVNSILFYDYPLVQACAIIMALVFTCANLLTDLLYTIIDPRIRLSERS